jgi:hypothetical protein
MTTARGEISSGSPGQLNEVLRGKVWLAQRRAEWPVTLMESESQVITWLKQNPDGAVWEYDIKPVSRVEMTQPEPLIRRTPQVGAPAIDMEASV